MLADQNDTELRLQNTFILREYLRPEMLPSTWCPGCGLGIVLSCIVQAVHYSGLAKDEVAMVSGIGCTGRMSGYADFYTMHTTHGRAPAYATGLKLARPDLTVITVMGDGDAMSIGGNHLVHAMRRNIGMVAVVVNNSVYGLTGGQSSPTTPIGGHTTTTRSGSFERPLNLEALARASGAAFFARATVNHTASLTKLVERALAISGCAVIEVLSNCHVLYGRMNETPDAAKMMLAMEQNTRRTNPTLVRRGQLPVRLTSSAAPAWPDAAAKPLEGVRAETHVARGVIFERKGCVDYGRRYYRMAAELRAKREKSGG